MDLREVRGTTDDDGQLASRKLGFLCEEGDEDGFLKFVMRMSKDVLISV